MWSPIDVFYIVWLCNFMPCEDARLNVSEIMKVKEDKIIAETIGVRDGI